MKKVIILTLFAIEFAGCHDSSQSKADVKNDSTILAAPETNSNMTNTRPVVIDSSRLDSAHPKAAADSPATK